MSDSQFFHTRIRRPGGTVPLTLCRKSVTLRDGTRVDIHFFERGDVSSSPAPPEYIIHEHMRSSLPLEWQVVAARTMVRVLGTAPHAAAETTGKLKASVEGLTPQQTEEVIRHIAAALDEE